MIKFVKKFTIKHLEPRFYGALWVVGTIIAVCTIILGVLHKLDRSDYKDEILFLSAILALIVGTIGWMWAGRMSILMTRKTNALAVLERLSSENVSALKVRVYEYVAEYAAYQEDDCAKSRPAMPETEIEQLLSVYEQVSIAVVYGAVDQDMIYQAQRLVFQRIYLGLRHHIDKVQIKNPLYYEYFERLTCTWHPEMQRKTAIFNIPGGLFTPMQDADS